MADGNQEKPQVTAETINALAANIDKFMTLWSMMTWRRLGMLCLFAAITIGGYTVWENRQNIYSKTIGRIDATNGIEPIKLSLESKSLLGEMVTSDKSIEMIQLIEIDPYKNTRRAIYWAAKPGSTLDAITRGPSGSGGVNREGAVLPLFSSDEIQNAQMVAVINNEFKCSPASKSGLVILYPQLAERLKVSCRVPLPPNGLGKLRGYLAIHTNVDMNQFQLDQLRLVAVQTSLKIYYGDIARDVVPYEAR